MKKAIIVILVIALFCAAAGCTSKTGVVEEKATASEYIESGTLRYPFVENGLRYALYDNCAIVIECVGSEPKINIPTSINGVPVVGINEEAFAGKETLVEVTIGGNVKSIDTKAFADCVNLSVVNMSGSVTEIAEEAFAGCSALRSIIIPSGVNAISKRSFYRCAALEKVIVESSAFGDDERTIDEGAFAECPGLETIWIPADVSTITEECITKSPTLRIFGDEKCASAEYATYNKINYAVTTREGFDTAARNYRPTVALVDGAHSDDTINAGGFEIKISKAGAYKTLGSIKANEGCLLQTYRVTVSNKESVPKYFDGFGVECTAYKLDRYGTMRSYTKTPLFVRESLLGVGYPSGTVAGNSSIEGILVLHITNNTNTVTVKYAGSDTPFVFD